MVGVVLASVVRGISRNRNPPAHKDHSSLDPPLAQLGTPSAHDKPGGDPVGVTTHEGGLAAKGGAGTLGLVTGRLETVTVSGASILVVKMLVDVPATAAEAAAELPLPQRATRLLLQQTGLRFKPFVVETATAEGLRAICVAVPAAVATCPAVSLGLHLQVGVFEAWLVKAVAAVGASILGAEVDTDVVTATPAAV